MGIVVDIIKSLIIVWLSLYFFVRDVNFFVAVICATIICNIILYIFTWLSIGLFYVWRKVVKLFQRK